MKIIILFALAGLSLAVGKSCYAPGRQTNAQCLEFAVNNDPDFSVNLASFMCHTNGRITRNAEKHNSLIEKLLLTLKCAGCALDVIPNIREDQTLNALTTAGKTLEDVARELLEFLDGLKLSEGSKKLLCALNDDALLSTFSAKALTKNLSPMPHNTKALICEGDRNAVTAKDVVQLLKNGDSFVDDAVGTDIAVEELATNLGKGLEGLLQKVLDLLQIKFQDVDGLICSGSV
ncbi:uncharacterized protein [Engystomops pustulosus]|uniref:uncharacterized protein isoform X2 n=1 Tax=Engystomops pustulosus TaxID=76066 RepID=UPI003AFA87E2